jgi:putative transposase
MVVAVRKKLKASERSVCRAVSQPRSTQRYKAQQRNGEKKLCDRMRELALRHPRYGYRFIAALLREEGFKVNVKRVHRLWRQQGLKVPQKQQRRRRLGGDGSSDHACHRMKAVRMNQVWSFDFCQDRTVEGRPLKIFSVIDEHTRRCLVIEVRRHLTGNDVVKILARLIQEHGAPEHIRCDNGPEFVSRAVRAWLMESKVNGLYIAPASPWENGYVESYHARLRDEVLDREEFATLLQARGILELWRQEYNNERPHGSLGYMTPAAFAASCRHAEPALATLGLAQHGEEEVSGGSVAL